MSPANKGKTYRPEPLTAAEVESLLKACSPRAASGVRNRALIALLYRTGLRISEALQLMPRHVDAAAGTVNVLHGKGDRQRTVGVDAGCVAAIQRWVDLRARLGINGTSPLFCTLTGRPVATAYIRALLPRLARRAGIEKRVHAHGLRHTHAVELRREGVSASIIQKQFGHANLATTDRYLNHVAPQEVVDTIRARPAWTPPR